MTTENKRDLAADLAICEAASNGFMTHTETFTGPYGPYVETQVFTDNCDRITPDDERFIIEAREGWPESIRRAMAAEEKWARLRAIIYTSATGGHGGAVNEYDIISSLMDDIAEDVIAGE